MDIRLLDGAKQDLRNGWFFYERQAPALADRCLDAIDSDSDAILDCRRDPSWIHERLAGPTPSP